MDAGASGPRKQLDKTYWIGSQGWKMLMVTRISD
jgi:hypothetical protein